MQAILLAAGESSRFWPFNKGNHKSQMYLLGKPLLYWTLKGLEENGIAEAVIICTPGSSLPEVLEQENNLRIKLSFAIQEKPLGTGNAVWQARSLIHGPFFVVWPNKIDAKTLIKELTEKAEQEKVGVVLMGSETSRPWDYGVFQFEKERAVEIVENPEQGAEPSNIRLGGILLLPENFFETYEHLPSHHEADLIDALNVLLKEKESRVVVRKEGIPSLKYPWDLFAALDILFASSYFKPGVAQSAKIGKHVAIEGKVYIGENTVIQDFVSIEGPCYIGNNVIVGSHATLRGPLDLENEVETRAFSEIKHTIFQQGVHFHSGYMGDSIVGKHSHFGAGFVAANRRLDRASIQTVVKGKSVDTNLTSLGVMVGENTSVGIHVGTMPGVLIGSHCIVGPGSVVFENIPDSEKLFQKA